MFKPQLVRHLYDEEAKRKPAHVGHQYAVFEKLDGWYGYFDVADGNIRSRAGRVIPSCTQLSSELRAHCNKLDLVSGIFIFEILVRGVPEFHILNGILNSKKICLDVYMKVHDFVQVECVPFMRRYKLATDLVEGIDADVSMIQPMLVTDEPHVWRELCNGVWEQGGEGVILKRIDAPYSEGKRNADMMKIKEEVTLDLWCIGLEEGQGKFAGMAGSLTLVDSAGNIHSVSGMGDADRMHWWSYPEKVTDRVVEVKAMKILKDGSLREPRFKAFRHDKGYEDID